MKTIIEMAGEAGIFNGDGDWSSCREEYEGVVKRFAELVRADEREALIAPERNFCPRCGKRTADLGTIHTCTPPIAAGPEAFYGLPHGSVSTPNAGGKCVTAGETAPIKEIDPNQWAFDRGLEST